MPASGDCCDYDALSGSGGGGGDGGDTDLAQNDTRGTPCKETKLLNQDKYLLRLL